MNIDQDWGMEEELPAWKYEDGTKKLIKEMTFDQKMEVIKDLGELYKEGDSWVADTQLTERILGVLFVDTNLLGDRDWELVKEPWSWLFFDGREKPIEEMSFDEIDEVMDEIAVFSKLYGDRIYGTPLLGHVSWKCMWNAVYLDDIERALGKSEDD